jgi:hypothetical protein
MKRPTSPCTAFTARRSLRTERNGRAWCALPGSNHGQGSLSCRRRGRLRHRQEKRLGLSISTGVPFVSRFTAVAVGIPESDAGHVSRPD